MKKLVPIISILLSILIPIKIVDANQTIMYVEPQTSTAEIFHTFQINISVSQVSDLAAWEFKLYYLNHYLNATQIQEGPFLKTAGQTSFFVKNFTDNYNSTHGMIWAFCTLIGQGSGATGNGTLATITFKAKQAGTATLQLAETDMLDSQMPPNHITHTTEDGTIDIVGHDIAITNITPLKTIVGQGYTMNVNVTAANQGSFTETFNVTLYANTTAINQTEITLTSGASTTITLTWNTTGFAYGNYTIKAVAEIVLGEVDIADNTFINGWIAVSLPGDLNFDKFVDGRDLGIVGRAYATFPSCEKWNPNADINEDRFIDGRDLGIVGRNYGKAA